MHQDVNSTKENSSSPHRFILVPVDFTQESVHALRYARMLATHMGMGITVAYIHQPLFDAVTDSAFDVDMMNKNRERLEEMMIEVGWGQGKAEKHVPVDTHFDTGDIKSQLFHLLENDKYEFAVMSTKAEDSMIRRVFESVSLKISRSVSKPVIVVPPGAAVKFPEKIVVGLSEELLHESALTYILHFVSDHHMTADFIFATNDDKQFTYMKDSLNEKLITLHKEMKGINIKSVPYEGEAIHEAIAGYATKVHAGLLVLVTKHRNFIEGLGHTSVSKKALLHPDLPVMILHAPDDDGLGVMGQFYDVIKEG
ncbi:MAG: universal stress protein [Saprospiraceae bacterium]